MSLLTDASQVRELYAEAHEVGFLIPGLGVENTDTLECILEAAASHGERLGAPDIPICVGFTANYPERTQLRNYTGLASALEGLRNVEDDLRRLLRSDGPFAQLRVHAHLDHGQPGLDDEVFDACPGFVGSVMYDASTRPLAENREMTKRFVAARGREFLVEGCVDEIPAEGEAKAPEEDLTRPEDARLFLEETGADLIVVNVGTEHRATHDTVQYRSDRARQIAQVAAGRMVLHGGSSLGDTPLSTIIPDGFVRFNLWTSMERQTGQAVARDTLANLGRILPRAELEALVSQGVLGPKVLENATGPSLDVLTHLHRRTEAWRPTQLAFLASVLAQCGHEKLAGR